MNKNSKIYVAGHRGLVGSAILRNLQKEGYENLVLRTSKELDLREKIRWINFCGRKTRIHFLSCG